MRVFGWSSMRSSQWWSAAIPCLAGASAFSARLFGAMIIQSVNTGILLSGFPPEFNLIIKAVIVLIILIIQSPALQSTAIFFSRKPEVRAELSK